MKHARILFLAALAACVSTTAKSPSTSPFAPAPDPNAPPPKEMPVVRKPWTGRFVAPSSLVADDVRIEGPQGLLDHVAVLQELDLQDFDEKTTSEGYVQTITLKPGLARREIRVHLDNMVVVALRRVTILERVRPVDVLVTATSDVYWKESDGGHEERGPTLRIEGRIIR